MTRFVSCLLASLVVVACSSSSDDSKQNGGASDLTDEQASALAGKYCDGVFMKKEPCFHDWEKAAAQTCKTDYGMCYAHLYRAGVIDGLVDCNKDANYYRDSMGACRGNEKTGDYCTFTVAKALPANPAYDDYSKKCYDKVFECGTGPGSFSNDFCDERNKLFFDDEFLANRVECFSKVCEPDAISNCLKDADNKYIQTHLPDSCSKYFK